MHNCGGTRMKRRTTSKTNCKFNRTINAKQGHCGSAKPPGGKKIGQILPGGQPLTPIKKISPIKKVDGCDQFRHDTFTMSSMITTTTWVRRGVAAQFPTKYEIDEAEMGRISKLARMQLEDAKDDMNAAQDGSGDEGDDAMEEDTEGKTSATNGTDSKE